MESVIIENVRCFKDRQEIPIRPLTLLVGENSSGKSTFLALTRLAWAVAQGATTPDFNEQPFQLGAYEQIAHFHGGRGQRAKYFTIGARLRLRHRGGRKRPEQAPSRGTVMGTFVSRASQPALAEWSVEAAPYQLKVAYPNGADGRLTFSSGQRSTEVEFPRSEIPLHWFFRDLFFFARMKARASHASVSTVAEEEIITREQSDAYYWLLSMITRTAGPQPTACAPVRSKPRRTYDPRQDVPEPDGGHIPMLLANLSEAADSRWDELTQHLETFGQTSGLLGELKVKRKGSKGSDPFQVHISFGDRRSFNLVDVGYGVSQALPILVDSLLADEPNVFLLQQPEVHLHPRAQAALGTLFGELVRQRKHRYIVETHSDYLLDRVRMEVREQKRGGIRPEDVVILYFEREEATSVRVHPIEITKTGDLENVPPGYRRFFLEEQRRLLLG